MVECSVRSMLCMHRVQGGARWMLQALPRTEGRDERDNGAGGEQGKESPGAASKQVQGHFLEPCMPATPT
jgi:hypothetical protein